MYAAKNIINEINELQSLMYFKSFVIDSIPWNFSYILQFKDFTLKLPGVRSKLKTKFNLIFLSKL